MQRLLKNFYSPDGSSFRFIFLNRRSFLFFHISGICISMRGNSRDYSHRVLYPQIPDGRLGSPHYPGVDRMIPAAFPGPVLSFVSWFQGKVNHEYNGLRSASV